MVAFRFWVRIASPALSGSVNCILRFPQCSLPAAGIVFMSGVLLKYVRGQKVIRLFLTGTKGFAHVWVGVPTPSKPMWWVCPPPLALSQIIWIVQAQQQNINRNMHSSTIIVTRWFQFTGGRGNVLSLFKITVWVPSLETLEGGRTPTQEIPIIQWIFKHAIWFVYFIRYILYVLQPWNEGFKCGQWWD